MRSVLGGVSLPSVSARVSVGEVAERCEVELSPPHASVRIPTVVFVEEGVDLVDVGFA